MSSEVSDWVRSLCGERKSVTYFVEVAFLPSQVLLQIV